MDELMNNRIGFHYFTDTDHYKSTDLTLWLNEFQQMKISWLVLQSPITHGIPEEFIKGLIKNGVTPIIHFDFPIYSSVKPDDIKVILSAYARWGIKYVIFYNSPNLKRSWAEGTWSQSDLVDRFLDRYIPLAELAMSFGLIPVFPPLQPGGDYWDTTFLKKTFLLLQQRKAIALISGINIAVSAQTFNKPLDWGMGGEAVWPASKPYSNLEAEDSQDQMGMHTWKWYTDIIQSVTSTTPKIFLFWYGASNVLEGGLLDSSLSIEKLIDMAQMDPSTSDPEMEGLIFDENVIACNLWILNSSAEESSDNSTDLLKAINHSDQAINTIKNHQVKYASQNSIQNDYQVARKVADWVYAIDHYLLLPRYDWGIPEYLFDRVRPIIRQFMPTIGFSLSEASLARKVTIWNENNAFSEKDILFLKQAGCEVDEQVITDFNK